MINNFRSEMETKLREKEQQEEEMDKEDKMEEETTINTVSYETVATESSTEKQAVVEDRGDIKVEVHATAVHHDQVVEPRVAHAMSHEISHSQAVSNNGNISHCNIRKRKVARKVS